MNHNQIPHGFPPPPPPPPPYYGGPPPQQPGHGKAVASLVCGILSLVFSWIFGGFLGIIAIALAMTARNEGYQGGLATGGLVTGIIGLSISALYVVSCIACVACLPFNWLFF